MNQIKKNYNYQRPAGEKEIVARMMDPNYDRGNLGLPEDASPETKMKYRIGKAILAYQQDNRLDLAEVAKRLSISQNNLYDICRGKVDNFALPDLINYLEKLAPRYELRLN